MRPRVEVLSMLLGSLETSRETTVEELMSDISEYIQLEL
jgi:hypothetical protein